MKKILSFLLLIVFSLMLVACSPEVLSDFLGQITQKDECTSHTDNDNDILCDKCGKTVELTPNEPEQPGDSGNPDNSNNSCNQPTTSNPENSENPENSDNENSESTTPPSAESVIEYVNVTLVYNNGTANKSEKAVKGKPLPTPYQPIKDSFLFLGWYTDEDCTRLYDFAKALDNDVTIYAKWVPDFMNIGNYMATEVIHSTLLIENYKYNTNSIASPYQTACSIGSGVVFDCFGGYYYCLTNNHVVDKGGYTYSEYTVYDVYGDAYEAELVATAVEYDLAILRFISEEDFPVATLADRDASVGDYIITVGNPNGVLNCVLYGIISDYKQIIDQSGYLQVDFEIFAHNAPIAKGSSGGAVFSIDYKVVGITFAGSYGADGVVTEAYFVPISRVVEFLSLYLYSQAA